MFCSGIAPEKGFLSVCSESGKFFLDFTQNKAFTCVWLSYAVPESSFWEQPFPLLSWADYTFDALYIWPEKCFGIFPTKLGCFEPYVTENSVFSLLCLKYVAFSFIAGKTCFGLFAVAVGCSQRYCNGKRFSPSLQRVTIIFTWFYSTKRFRLFPARWRCFQQYVSENRLFLSFLPKLRFWPFILPKPSFGLVATKLEASSFMSQKAAI